MEFISEGADGQIYAISELEVIKVFRDSSKFDYEANFKNKFILSDLFVLPKREMNKNTLVYERARGEFLNFLDEFNELEINLILNDFQKKFFKLYSLGYIYVDFRPQNIVLMKDNKTIKLVDLCGLRDVSEINSNTYNYEQYKHNYKSPYELMIVKNLSQLKLKTHDLPVCAHFFYYLNDFYATNQINEYNYKYKLSLFPDSILFIKKINNIINKTYYIHENKMDIENLQKFKIDLINLLIINLHKIKFKTT